jgi:hypothetical protein
MGSNVPACQTDITRRCDQSNWGTPVKPFYTQQSVIIYHGDAREVIPQLKISWDSCITDPVWPNACATLKGADCPDLLMAETLHRLVGRINRLVVHLGANSDPRFLFSVPQSMPFLRVCWLRYARPSYLGRFLNGGDVAYCFGEWPKSKPGARVLPGEHVSTENRGNKNGHPCPRHLSQARFLVNFWAGTSVIDPFAGSGTTGLACAQLGIPCTLIEIEERFCEIAAGRLRTMQMEFSTK